MTCNFIRTSIPLHNVTDFKIICYRPFSAVFIVLCFSCSVFVRNVLFLSEQRGTANVYKIHQIIKVSNHIEYNKKGLLCLHLYCFGVCVYSSYL